VPLNPTWSHDLAEVEEQVASLLRCGFKGIHVVDMDLLHAFAGAAPRAVVEGGLPHQDEAERAVLGAVLLDDAVLPARVGSHA
jgi:hypothetical protein